MKYQAHPVDFAYIGKVMVFLHLFHCSSFCSFTIIEIYSTVICFDKGLVLYVKDGGLIS